MAASSAASAALHPHDQSPTDSLNAGIPPAFYGPSEDFDLARLCGAAGVTAFCVLQVLRAHRNRDTKLCCPKLETIGDRIGVSKRTVQRALDLLEATNRIRRVRRGPTTDQYEILSLVQKKDMTTVSPQGSEEVTAESPHFPEEVTPETKRGDTGDQRGDTGVTKTGEVKQGNQQLAARARENESGAELRLPLPERFQGISEEQFSEFEQACKEKNIDPVRFAETLGVPKKSPFGYLMGAIRREPKHEAAPSYEPNIEQVARGALSKIIPLSEKFEGGWDHPTIQGFIDRVGVAEKEEDFEALKLIEAEICELASAARGGHE